MTIGSLYRWFTLFRCARVNDFVRTPLEPYDVAKIREDFPILTERPYGRPLVYRDNAASAQKPKAVIDRLVHAYGDDRSVS